MKSLSNGVEVVYLYHFSQPYHHAQHYLGSTNNWKRRHREHITGNGSPLIKAVLEAGLSAEIVWLQLGGKNREAELKRVKNNRLLCPICSPSVPHEG